MNNPNTYHSFLLRHRIYCEHCGCIDKLTHATTVLNVNGHDTCLCNLHAGRLDAARKSDERFLEQEAKHEANRPRIEMTP